MTGSHFVRGLLPMETETELRAHLDRGCTECVSAMAFWKKVEEFFTKDDSYRPPLQVLQDADSLFLPQRPWRWLISVAQWAERVFDSSRQPIPAFVRGSAPSGRHLIHEAKPFVIDLKIEPDLVKNRLSLVGQILDSENPESIPPGIDVVLLSGEDLVAKTTATQSGEFALQCEQCENLRLFINIRGDRAIGVALSEN